MKRGFLRKAEEKKVAARRRNAQEKSEPSAASTAVPHPGPRQLADRDNTAGRVETIPQRALAGFGANNGILSHGNLSEAEKALPSDYNTNRKIPWKVLDPRLTKFNENVQLITSIPQPVPDDEIQCEWIVKGSTKAKVLNAEGYPACIPKPRRPDLYEVRSTQMGQGLFATRNIKRGDLILAERPLLVYHRMMATPEGASLDNYTIEQQKQVTMFEFEKLLETALSRFPPENQADFRALHNSHKGDGSGPLLGIARTNNYRIDNLYDGSDRDATYNAICKIASRINHSCIPNVKNYFKLNSFSMQFYAIRDIKAGDQLFYSYCLARGNQAERQAELAPYGFACKCTACVNATPETDELRRNFQARIVGFQSMVVTSQINDSEILLEDALRLEKAMIKEGLDAHIAFESLMMVIFLLHLKLGHLEEVGKYDRLIEESRKCRAGEE